MSGDLEAQARRVLEEVYGWHLEYDIPPTIRAELLAALTSWARRLVAESRAGALRKARAAVGKADNLGAAYAAVCAIPASAEAEPGAQG